MKVLLGNGGGSALRLLMETRSDIGNLFSPRGWRTHAGTPYACDNDAFSSWQKSLDHRLPADQRSYWANYWCDAGVGEERWYTMLEKIPGTFPPLWVLLPDVVADWHATLKRAHWFREQLSYRGLRCAVALQDGCRFEDVQALAPHTVFVGGSKLWKWTHLEEIVDYFHPRGIGVHVGRVSGVKGIAECLRLRVDSCDGTGWLRAPDQELPRLLKALDQRAVHPQMGLGL